jgi:hypothetical protein
MRKITRDMKECTMHAHISMHVCTLFPVVNNLIIPEIEMIQSERQIDSTIIVNTK